VVATGFLPGVLSFLCALSHLERITHRHLFPQAQQWKKWLRVTASGQRSHAQARSRAVDAHRFSRHNTGFFDSNRGETGSFRIDHSFLVQYGGIHGFFSSQKVYEVFSAELASVVLLRAHTPSGSPLPMRECTPFTVHPNCFIRMHQGRHLSPWRLHAFHQHASPSLVRNSG
jgi:hypothetical protein